MLLQGFFLVFIYIIKILINKNLKLVKINNN